LSSTLYEQCAITTRLGIAKLHNVKDSKS